MMFPIGGQVSAIDNGHGTRRFLVQPAVLILLLTAGLSLDSASRAEPQFTAEVPRVLVDVIVREAGGAVARDLRATDFVVYEDGKRVEIIDLQFVDVYSQPGTVAVPPTPAAEYSRDTAASSTSLTGLGAVASDVHATVFVVDFEGLDWLSKERFGDAMARLLSRRERLSTPWAIYLIDQIGYLSEVAALTVDVSTLANAIEAVRATPLVQQSQKDRLISAQAGGGSSRLDPFKERARAMRTFRRLALFADSLAAREGRTSLVWISSGVHLLENARGKFATPSPQVLRSQKDFHQAANTGRVSVYGVDPSRLIDLIPDTADVRHGPVQPSALSSPLQRMANFRPSMDAMRDSLREAASATGGRAFVGWADLQEVVAEIEKDARAYYLLTYRPPEPRGDGRYHEIRVEVDRPDVRVQARAGYVDYSATERAGRRLGAALALPGTTSGLEVRGEVYRGWRTDGKASVLVMAATSIQQDATQAESTDDAIDAHAVIVTPSGDTVAQVSGFAQRTQGSTEHRAAVFTFRHTFTVDPGAYSVRVAFQDRLYDTIGATSWMLDVAALTAGDWRTSDPLLFFVDNAGNRRPAFGSALATGEQALAVVEVYNGTAPRLGGRITRIGSAIDGHETAATLSEVALEQADPRLHRGAVALPRLAPGEYALHLSLIDSSPSRNRFYELVFSVDGS